ncbi:hypothetical protein JCM9279_004991 [Rhodotorula babjevae]
MSSVLPQELFDFILEKLAEPPLDDNDYFESKYALAKAARSSRCLYPAAQANLWRNIWLQDTTEDEMVPLAAAAGGKKLGTRTHTLVYSASGWPSDDTLTEAVDIAHVFPNIVDTYILCCLASRITVSFRYIHTHTQLRHLSLLSLVPLDCPLRSLPALETLDICNCRISESAARVWLQHDVLPRLRVLRLLSNFEDERSSPLDVEAVVGPSLLPQLDYVMVDDTGMDTESELANGVVPPFLFYFVDDQFAPLPRHSMPLHANKDDWCSIDDSLQTVADQLEHSTESEPFVVVIPRSVLDLADKHELTAVAVRRLEARASARAARLMWIPEEPCWDSRARTEGEFRTYGRELRLAREAAAA